MGEMLTETDYLSYVCAHSQNIIHFINKHISCFHIFKMLSLTISESGKGTIFQSGAVMNGVLTQNTM